MNWSTILPHLPHLPDLWPTDYHFFKHLNNFLQKKSFLDQQILGLVENLSYLECPDCGKKIEVFGKSHIDEVSQKHSIPVLARIPIDSKLASGCDGGLIELHTAPYIDDLLPVLDGVIKK